MGRRHDLRQNFRFLTKKFKMISDSRGSFLYLFHRNQKIRRFRRKWVGGMYFGNFFDFWQKNVKWSAVRGDHFCIDFVEFRKFRSGLYFSGPSMLCTTSAVIFAWKMSRHFRMALRVTRAVTKVDSLLHATSLNSFWANQRLKIAPEWNEFTDSEISSLLWSDRATFTTPKLKSSFPVQQYYS